MHTQIGRMSSPAWTRVNAGSKSCAFFQQPRAFPAAVPLRPLTIQTAGLPQPERIPPPWWGAEVGASCDHRHHHPVAFHRPVNNGNYVWEMQHAPPFPSVMAVGWGKSSSSLCIPPPRVAYPPAHRCQFRTPAVIGSDPPPPSWDNP